jgi:hypothetical protein
MLCVTASYTVGMLHPLGLESQHHYNITEEANNSGDEHNSPINVGPHNNPHNGLINQPERQTPN